MARKEWRGLATPLDRMGVRTVADGAVFAVSRQAYSRRAQVEEKPADTPMLIKAPSGYPQLRRGRSAWLARLRIGDQPAFFLAQVAFTSAPLSMLMVS